MLKQAAKHFSMICTSAVLLMSGDTGAEGLAYDVNIEGLEKLMRNSLVFEHSIPNFYMSLQGSFMPCNISICIQRCQCWAYNLIG